MARRVSDVVFQVTHIPIHLKAYPIARHNCNTTSTTETFFYFYPAVIPLLSSSYNLLFPHFGFTVAIHTWNPNERTPVCHHVLETWLTRPVEAKDGGARACERIRFFTQQLSPRRTRVICHYALTKVYTGKQATLLATTNKIS